MKKTITKLLLVFFLMIIYAYTLAIENIPNHLVIFEGEEISIKTLLGMQIKMDTQTMQTLSNYNTSTIDEKTKKANLQVSLFDNVSLKDVNVDILPRTKVIPVGSIAGVKLYTSGVLVVGMSEIEGMDNKKHKPYENTGIKEGDTITQINNVTISSTEQLMKTVNQAQGQPVKVKYIQEEETKECSIEPVQTSSNEYKLGLWVRDSAAGVGTVTFYEPSSKTFGALGHGITDIDTEELIHIASGEFVTTRILNITKGESGTPGKIQGTVENQQNIGKIYKNSKFGIYGSVDNLASLKIDTSKEMEVALREEIELGKATILCCLDNQKVEEYEIEIQKIYKENNYNNKSMQIKVTDERLLEKTGGIIQGMSGSPVIQNGKFVGAVTHVLVNNPQEGYAVFGDIMLKQSKEVK
ncbi:MAG: SpoIVB peptidase [Clostridia bacterium]|nr:SpoIVB peptidase [Clostridia bacterium]